MSETPKLRIIFDGPPAHKSGRFVEVEDEAGGGVRVGEWVADKEPYWALVIDDPRALRSRIATLESQVEQAREALEGIAGYWNRDRNDEAMHDACWHAIETAEAALQALREGGENA